MNMRTKCFSGLSLTGFLLFAFNLMLCASVADNKPLLHPLFTDHTVLQRDARVPVWGWTEPGATVTVSFAGQEKSAYTSPDGKWMVYLDPMPANAKGRVLKVQSTITNQKAKISDILVGDVWICSGQSNMEMGIGACKVPDEIAAAHYPRIRLLIVPKKIAYTPESTLQCAWLPCSPANLIKGGWSGFSAAGYFFGRELHRDLDVPIGLIETCWGGTVCEAWTSGEALVPLSDFASGLEQVMEVASTPGTDKLGVVMDKWYQTKDPGTSKGWFKPETDVSAWKTATMPANWNACGIPGFEGVVWAQGTFEAPAAWAGKELTLSFGTIGDCDVTWVNGIAVGRTDYYDEPRIYKVPAAVLKTGTNVIAMRVVNSGGGGFFGPTEQMKVYPSGDESSAISLATSWRVQETAPRAVTGAPLVGNPNISSVLYNGMIAPLIPFAIQGAIWYQGEANADRAYQYNELLQTMITDWRLRFGVGDFGFHIVSLANYMKTSAVPQESAWAELREAQAMAAKALPDCGIAMAIDIGDAADIHPKNKKEVGRRLALNALAINYGKNIEWSGPSYKSMEITGKGIRLSFDHARSGLVAKGAQLTGFAIAGADRKFVWADATIDGTTVMVSSPEVPAPVSVRYGWANNPVGNLYNKENLPAVPFRTDEWPGITKPTDQQVIYPPSAVPIVDMHTHMDAKTQYAKAVDAMDQWGGTISITLAGIFWVKDNNDSAASPASVKQIPYNDMVYVKEKLNNRILFVPGAFTIPSKGIWWSVDDIKTFKEQGFVGIKLWPHGAILTSAIPQIHEQLDEAGRQGMPLIALHTGDPGTKDENSAAYPKFEEDAVAVASQHPQTTFIFAHGLFMLENDEGLDKLAGIFDKYPNIFVDLAYTHNMRQTARYTVSKARDFYIRYRDRLLFGTDVFAAGAGAAAFLNERKVLETNQVTSGLSKGPQLEGFNLPDSVLNPIYYWNAARLIPRVREVLEARGFRIGYELGSFKFDRLPPDVTVNQLTINGRTADITGTLGSVTTSLIVEIAGKVYAGVDNMNGTWKLPGNRIAGLLPGTYDVKVTATNSIGLVRTDRTTNELTVKGLKTEQIKRQPVPEPADPDKPDLSVWKNIKPGIHSGFGSIDVAYSKSIPPAEKAAETINLRGWKGERVNCLLLVWSAGTTEEISIKASGFRSGNHQTDKGITSVSVVRYVLCNEFKGGCGARDKDKDPVHISPDLLSNTNSFTLDAPGSRPVWISVDIPQDMPAGKYTSTISRQSASGTVNHTVTLEVLDQVLPSPSDWSFHLDLWQNPYSVARFHQVEPWSEEHISLLRPLLTRLAGAGQKCITTTLIDDPWDGQPYDPFGSMIRWTKKSDGTWAYDYSVFDLYVNLAMEAGIREQINCYSMVPVGNKFSWFDEKSGRSVTVETVPGTAEYESIWRSFLIDFRKHLRVKGWLDKTAIALDEREEEEMEKMFHFIRETAPELKISMAGFYYDKVNSSIYDFSSNWRHIDTISGNIMDSRRRLGLKTTYYVACGIPKPNNFTFSPPAESCYEGWFASAMGFDGFLRWAYNSWVENPEVDSRYIQWPSGDTYLVYPDAQSSIRFERLREGIQDYEKIRILRQELAKNQSMEAAAALERLDHFLNSINTRTLDQKSAADVVNTGKQLLYQASFLPAGKIQVNR
jgi:sialate O-acetylesterase